MERQPIREAGSHPSALRKSLRASTLDATSHGAMVGFGETFFPAYALLLGATPLQVGLLATLPILAGALFQILSVRLATRIGHKRWVVTSALLQACTFMPIIAVAWLPDGFFAALLSWVCLYWMLALGINPAWNAWMGRMIPRHIRSRYFGRRTAPVQLALLISVLGGGFLLDGSQRTTWGAAAGFAAIFALASISRLTSTWFLTRQHDPAKGALPAALPMRDIFAGMRSQPYGHLILLLVLLNGSVHVSAAYFTPFMLESLHLSYARFTILTAAILVTRVVASAYWGEIAYTYGNRRALQVAGVLLVPLSALWTLSDNFAYLVGLQLFAGFAWAGFELTGILNFFDCTDDRNRAQVLSVYNLLNGVAIVCASLIGGTVLRHMGDQGYAVIFLASGVMRAATIVLVARGVGARRQAQEHSFSNVFVRVISLRPGQGADLRPVVMSPSQEAD